ncbi:MAG: Ni/Fe hydrogenase subunit alpha [Coriobacteriales bacterium]|jgi:coenzyme F420-reducing hydrogenase alpha subunit|nr:Ni/Fe hydrogenase subunit alpha [Coriobacteriales bacterium]
MTTRRLSIDHVARIEGHGNVHVKVEDGTVTTVEMNVTEAARFFESLMRGRSYREVSYIASRICGICSASHTVTSLQAVEDALGIEVSERTRLLRLLLVYGSFLQNHATHLFVLAAPDFIGTHDVFPLAQSDPELLELALGIKQLGNELCTIVGGRSIHPIHAVVGGFTSEPSKCDLLLLAERLDGVVDGAAKSAELFNSFTVPDLETQGDFLSLYKPDDYAVIDGDVRATRSAWVRPGSAYRSFIDEVPVRHSNAKFSTIDEGTTYMTGALARINNSWDHLTRPARMVAAKVGLRPVTLNTYRNNVCQAIELVDVAVRCAELCRALANGDGSSQVVPFALREGAGTGVTEAPRGVLFHYLELDADGIVTAADICTPTAQSLANLESDIRLLAPQIANRPAPEFKLLIEELVRAYDPCLSCAVH